MALLPQLVITVVLQPQLVKYYCYIAAIVMGAENQKDDKTNEHGGGGHGGGHEEQEHHHHHGHFDEAEFSHILELV